MIVKENFNLNFNLSGNIMLTIPKSYLQNADQETLLNFTSDWNGDSAADIVGICESSTNDGSVHHDRDIYGL
jgi:hypothetical protein